MTDESQLHLAVFNPFLKHTSFADE